MKFSYNWLTELIDGTPLAPRELGRLITMKTAECEGVVEHAPWLAQVVAARVESVTPIANSHNVAAVVDAGPAHGRKQVVCGAPNCKPGVVTAYVPAGVTLGGKEIRKAVIAGVESDGMLASGAELGLNRDHEGIVEIAAAPGAPLPGIRPDFVLEIDNKSITHRPDLWGHHGMAREAAAILGLALREPADLALIPRGANEWRAVIEDFSIAPRYSALVFENVTVAPSPLWLQARLEALDLNPISNIVDVTNFIMAELAQPMHAFDAAKLHGRTIFVRRARAGETIEALNGESYTLTPDNVVIADDEKAVAVGGVIGGANSAISAGTTRIVLESACFAGPNIRKTSSQLKLRTDASMRFEKCQDPANTLRGLARAVALLREVCSGIRLVGGLVDTCAPAAAPAPIRLPLDWMARKLGRTVEPAEVRRILESLAFGVTAPEPGVFSVTVPSWRATRDVSIKEDLVEEVGRMVGYDTVPPAAPELPVHRPWINAERDFHHAVRNMAAAQGFTETYNYSFINEEQAARFGFPVEGHLRVANPITADNTLLRTSLLPGIHRNLLENAKRFDEVRLFEIGSEIHPRAAGELPDEIPHLMAALYSKGDGAAALYELKRLAECLMPGCELRPSAPLIFQHPARSAAVSWRGATLGSLYELHPSLVETGRGAVLDIDLRALMPLAAATAKYMPLQRYPSSAFDLSILAGLHELAGELEAKIAAAAGALLDSIDFLRIYQGPPLPDDRKSVSFRVTVAAPDHTLSNDEVTAVRQQIIDALQSAGYDLRL